STGSQFCDGLNRMINLNAGEVSGATNGIGGKLHMMRETTDPVMPWTVYLLGLWIPNFFYWGLNQYIMQRTLASKSLEEGQLGIVFAAFLKLLIPFVVIIPGILAYNLYRDDLAAKADSNTTAIIAAAESTGKKVIYDISASRFVRTDSADSSVDYVKKNLAMVGAADKVAEVDAKAAELAAIPAKDIAAREKVAKQILAIDKEATAAAAPV
ncbi:MAG: transporter, partial [Akkermansia sp.]|nr:transporter [Akkermansia sp.]